MRVGQRLHNGILRLRFRLLFMSHYVTLCMSCCLRSDARLSGVQPAGEAACMVNCSLTRRQREHFQPALQVFVHSITEPGLPLLVRGLKPSIYLCSRACSTQKMWCRATRRLMMGTGVQLQCNYCLILCCSSQLLARRWPMRPGSRTWLVAALPIIHGDILHTRHAHSLSWGYWSVICKGR